MTSNVDLPGPPSSGPMRLPEMARTALSQPVVMALFLVCASQPYGLALGPLLIGPYRLILLLIGPVLMLQWLMGRFGRWQVPDFMVLGYAMWMLVSLAANGQVGRLVEWGGAQFIDTFFAYLLGRAAIRTKRDFYYFTRILMWVLLILLPFAILESTQGLVILIRLFQGLPMIEAFPIVVGHHEPRMGLLRAQTGAAHPILYGILCSMGFSFGLLGMAHAPGKPSFMKRAMLSAGTYLGTFFSLSSGAFAATGIQGLLMLWNWVLRSWDHRWRVLAAGGVAFYTLVAIISDRPPALALGRLISFSPSTAWNRYMIWQFGSAEVMRNPIFGMGHFLDWQRAAWMPVSIDNHWLLTAMRFGLVGIGLLMGAFLYVLYRLIRKNFSNNPEMGAIRDSFVFTLIALLIAYGTVASWNIQWSLLLVLLGGSVWIFSTEFETQGKSPATDGGARPPRGVAPDGPSGSRYTRTRRITASEAALDAAPESKAEVEADIPAGRDSGSKYSRFAPRTRGGPPKG